jgi:hypothetical protein
MNLFITYSDGSSYDSEVTLFRNCVILLMMSRKANAFCWLSTCYRYFTTGSTRSVGYERFRG